MKPGLGDLDGYTTRSNGMSSRNVRVETVILVRVASVEGISDVRRVCDYDPDDLSSGDVSPMSSGNDRLLKYRLGRLLGSGGMGSVYLARDLALDRDVAIKFITADKASDPSARQRLIREARAAAALEHPNICTVHEVIDDPDGRAAIVMQYVEGQTLAEKLRGGALDPRDAISIATDVANALAAAHRRNIIHRDIKPQNIIITSEKQAKILDFGVARHYDVGLASDAETTAILTTPGVIVGTPAYMSPEQAEQQPLDGRSDLFSLGAVLYECLTGRRPFTGRSPIDVLGAVLHHEPPPVSSVRPGLTPQHDEVVARLLEKHPDDRFKSADELLGALRLLAGTSRVTAHERPPLRRRWWRRRYTVAALIAAGVLGVAAATWITGRSEEVFPGSILIADIQDQAGDPSLAQAVREGLTVNLQQSHTLKILSREQVVEALHRMERNPGSTSLDHQTALEVCQREGIDLLLAGTLHKRGDAIFLTVNGVDPTTKGATLTVTSEFQSYADVFRSLDGLARDVRRELGESTDRIAQTNQPLADVTTPSFEALKLYSQARDQHIRGDADTALPLVAQALQLDPTFAMAHRLVARLYQARGNTVKATEHLTKAFELRAKLSQKERFQVEASYFKGEGQYDQAVQTLTAGTNLFPTDGETRYELALAYRDKGDAAKAIEQLELTLQNAPLTTSAYADLVLLLARAGQYDRGRTVYGTARGRNVGGAKLEWAHAMVLLGEGRMADARRQLDPVRNAGGVYAGTARLYLATADILEGKLRAASERLEADLLLDSKDDNEIAEFIRRELFARTLLLQGRREEAKKQLAVLLSTLSRQPLNAWWHERLVGGTLALRLGDSAGASAVLKQLEQQRTTPFGRNCYYTLAGKMALADGKAAEAGQHVATAAAHYPRAITTEALARAYSQQRDWPRATAEWVKVVNSKGDALREHFAAEWVLAHLELARASHAAGDAIASAKYYEAFLELWKNSDPLPVLLQAREELQRLAPKKH